MIEYLIALKNNGKCSETSPCSPDKYCDIKAGVCLDKPREGYSTLTWNGRQYIGTSTIIKKLEKKLNEIGIPISPTPSIPTSPIPTSPIPTSPIPTPPIPTPPIPTPSASEDLKIPDIINVLESSPALIVKAMGLGYINFTTKNGITYLGTSEAIKTLQAAEELDKKGEEVVFPTTPLPVPVEPIISEDEPITPPPPGEPLTPPPAPVKPTIPEDEEPTFPVETTVPPPAPVEPVLPIELSKPTPGTGILDIESILAEISEKDDTELDGIEGTKRKVLECLGLLG